MKLRPDFAVYISDLRHQEFAMIFGACPADLFDRALELGAGWRAIHSTLLATRARHVLSTDFKDAILEHTPSERIAYRVCDAEHVGDVFAPQSFDLIFSSNLLEHLPDLQGTLRGIHDVLTDDGITIHVMPSRFFQGAGYARLSAPAGRLYCGRGDQTGRPGQATEATARNGGVDRAQQRRKQSQAHSPTPIAGAETGVATTAWDFGDPS